MSSDNKTHYELVMPGMNKGRVEAKEIHDKWMEHEVGRSIPTGVVVEFFANSEQHLIQKFEGTKHGHRTNDGRFAIDERVGKPWMHQVSMGLVVESLDYLLKQQEHPYSYEELANNHHYRKLFEYLNGDVFSGDSSMITMMIMLYHCISHERAGKRVYTLTDPLAAKLKYTELRGLRSEDLRLPYENVYLQVPKSAGLQVYNEETEWHDCIGVYITEDKGSDEYVKNVHAAHPEKPKLEGGRSWRIMAVGRSKGFVDIGSGGGFMLDDALSYFRIPLPDGWTLDECLTGALAEMHNAKDSSWVNMDNEWQNIFRWAMNAMLYATWTEPGERWVANKEARLLWQRIQKIPGKTNRKSKLNRKLRSLDQQRRIVLGRTVVIDRSVQHQGEESTNGGSKLKVRTRVSGHWKQQPYGPGSKLRKLIWREPFWRGPKDGPIATPTHEMR